MSDIVQKIRKVVTHVPTGMRWQSIGLPVTKTLEIEYDKWMMRVMHGETNCFTLFTGLNDNHTRLTMINAELLKQCVVEVEVYEYRDK